MNRIQNIVNVKVLSKDCTEEPTNTDIVLVPEIPSESDLGTPAPTPETAAPMVETTKAEESPDNDKGGLQVGIDVGNIDPKFVCRAGCKDVDDAERVLSFRVNLENAFAPYLDHFSQQEEVPTACTEKC